MSVNLSIEWGVANVPHPDKGSGEDTWFILPNSAGVFDGVGSWADQGVNPVFWSMALADGCRDAILTGKEGPISVLKAGYRNAQHSAFEGSCTACLTIMNTNGNLAIANLGDSSVAIYRGETVIFQTEEQEYAFNYPYQLSSDGDAKPADADRHLITSLKSGDCVVLGTDGLWDNLYHREITKFLDDDLDCEDIATNLAVSAFHASNDQKRWSPFGQAAVENLYADSPYAGEEDFEPPAAPLVEYLGGKPDDITVIVGRVI